MSKYTKTAAIAAALFAAAGLAACDTDTLDNTTSASDAIITQAPANTESGFGSASGAGESLTFSESDNAVRSAEQYLSVMPFSQQGLADQLVFEGYSVEDAQNAAATVDADWNEQAVKSGQSYLSMMPMSQQELHDQLVFEKYTPEQAQFAVNQLFG